MSVQQNRRPLSKGSRERLGLRRIADDLGVVAILEDRDGVHDERRKLVDRAQRDVARGKWLCLSKTSYVLTPLNLPTSKDRLRSR
jgi:hypothetical protein